VTGAITKEQTLNPETKQEKELLLFSARALKKEDSRSFSSDY
jgi:hypothetical protein